MYALAALLVAELLRFHLSKHLRQEIDVSLEEYRERLLDQRYIQERSVRESLGRACWARERL